MNTKPLLDELLTSCVVELFASRDVALTVAPGAVTQVDYAGVIGFSGDQMRGVVGLGMSNETLNSLVRQQASTRPDPLAEDWLGEASNQLLGRMKNRMLRYGVVVTIALPSVLTGEHLEVLSSGRRAQWNYGFESAAGTVRVWFEVQLEPGVVFEESTDPDLQAASEGEMMLF